MKIKSINRTLSLYRVCLFVILVVLNISGLSENIYSQSGTEGYYKDLFMDGGVNLTSRTTLPAADYLGLSVEFLATSSLSLQSSLLISNLNDQNGILLYPDGEPRFRIIYTNGGSASKHGESLGEAGRENIKTYFQNGGAYTGSCAGAFIASLSPDTTEQYRESYYHIWPGYTLSTRETDIYTGHTIPENSPLLDYYQFGGDYYVANVRHNGGGFAYEPNMPEGTEVLARYDYPASGRMHNKASVIAYKSPFYPEEGRLVTIGSHPESITSGERLDLMAAILQYAVDGQGENHVKAALNRGEERVMDRSTYNNDPAYTKIGDKQYHHFKVDLPEGAYRLVLSISGDDNYDLSLYVNRDDFAFNSNAIYKDRSAGSYKTMILTDLEAGTYYVSVECETTVSATWRSEYYEYTGNLDVLNGVAYSIYANWSSPATSVDQLELTDCSLYPNPFSTDLYLRLDQAGSIDNITITDLGGYVVYKQKITSPANMLRIDLADKLSPGIYILRIKSENNTIVKRIVKAAK